MTASKRISRRGIWIVILLTLLVVVVFVGVRWLERTVLERSERIVAQISGPGSRIQIGQVDLKLLPGNITWSDLRIDQPAEGIDTAEGDRSMRLNGRVDEIAVRGLSLWRLLFAKTLSMRSITIIHPELEALMMTDTIDSRPVEEGSIRISALNADSVVVENAVFSMHHTGGDSTTFSVDTLSIHVTGIRSRWKKNKPFELRYATATCEVRGIHAMFPPVYDLRVARIELDQDGRALHVTDVTLKPLKGPQEYDQVVHFETDLFDVHLDTAMMSGLDLASLINARTLATSTMRIAGADLNIFRDKTMPDEPFKHKALPARLVRELPITVCMDSLVVDRWNVRYHEKNDLTPDYGEVAFSEIHGTVRGFCSADTLGGDTLVVSAIAKAYDQANVSLNVRTVIADTTDRFTVEAKINGLPFGVFNQMTADLLLVRATAGTIGGIDLTMTADDDRATGRVDMEYDHLELELLKEDGSGERRKFLSGLMNQVIHTRNLRSDPGFRHGDFAFERQKDRSIFNYLWSGLREGMIATALPGVLESVRQLDQTPGKE